MYEGPHFQRSKSISTYESRVKVDILYYYHYCPALNGNLASPTHQQASPPPRLSSSAPTHTPPLTCSDLMDSSLSLPSHLPLLPPSPYLSHHHHPQAHNQSTTRRPTLKQIHASLAISEFCNGMPAVFPPPVVLN